MFTDSRVGGTIIARKRGGISSRFRSTISHSCTAVITNTTTKATRMTSRSLHRSALSGNSFLDAAQSRRCKDAPTVATTSRRNAFRRSPECPASATTCHRTKRRVKIATRWSYAARRSSAYERRDNSVSWMWPRATPTGRSRTSCRSAKTRTKSCSDVCGRKWRRKSWVWRWRERFAEKRQRRRRRRRVEKIELYKYFLRLFLFVVTRPRRITTVNLFCIEGRGAIHPLGNILMRNCKILVSNKLNLPLIYS